MRKSMRGKRRGGEDKSFWLCFSDLMSTLVLVLVLIMFYSLYLHFDTMEEAIEKGYRPCKRCKPKLVNQ